jgi:hypothetical protein
VRRGQRAKTNMELVAFVAGLFLRPLWFRVVLLPLLYGMHRSLAWARRGWTTLAPTLQYLTWPSIWLVVIAAAIWFRQRGAPEIIDALVTSHHSVLGQAIGAISRLGTVLLSAPARSEIGADFRRKMVRNLTPAGIRALGTGEFPS